MINNKKLIYLGGPYSHDEQIVRNKRYNTYRKLAGLIIDKHDAFVFSPITHSHPIVTHKSFDQAHHTYEVWMPIDLAILDICDELWIAEIDGWELSKGTKQEIEYARLKGMPIRFITKRGRVYDYES